MKQSLEIVAFFLIILAINGEPNCDGVITTTTENPNPTRSIYQKLDTFCDSKTYGWYVSPTRYDDWFFYFDNLTDLTSSPHAEGFFQNVSETSNFTLPNFGGVDGVWVTYHSRLPPYFAEPYARIKLPNSNLFRRVEISYYLHKNAFIRLGDSIVLRRAPGDEQEDGWMTFSMDYVEYNFVIELHPEEEGEFVLIDKIVYYYLLTPTTIPTSPHPDYTSTRHHWRYPKK